MSAPRLKTLCLLFKYLGDVAVAVPAIRALRRYQPEHELHLLVAEDAVPIVRHLPWVTQVWGLPRKRGRAQWSRTLPILSALRQENFECSVDFVGNDRGALVSRVVGARRRVGLIAELGFWGRRWCYNVPVPETQLPREAIHETERHAHLLRLGLGVPVPECLELEIHADPALRESARQWVPGHPLIGHLSTSQPKKEWPAAQWHALYQRAKAAGVEFLFATGPSPREQALLETLRSIDPTVPVLPSAGSLDGYLAMLSRARGFVSGDTGPLHFAAGLGVPTLGLFAPTDAARWAPLGQRHRHLTGCRCACSGHTHICAQSSSCMESLSVDNVWSELQSLLGM
jgi:ADP-heptose:LPS heptosyltransferase